MAIRTKADLMSVISAALGDSSSDETLQLLEDLSDTLTDFETRIGEDWKTKYEQNDEQWRTRYRERFFTGTTPPEIAAKLGVTPDPERHEPEQTGTSTSTVPEPAVVEQSKPETYDALFTMEGV